jgi:beta-galactosidase/beta-glucuronidase
LRSDWTKNQLYSLADQTTKVVDGLDKDITITAFYKSAEQRSAQDLLDEYAYRTGKLNYEFIDPDEKPQIARQYQISKYNTVVVESGVKKETLEELSETNLTNAIIKVTREQDKVVYFLTGHGERSVSEEGAEGFKNAVEAIKKENHMVRELNLARRIGEGKGHWW